MDDPVNTIDESSTTQVETKTGDYVIVNLSGLAFRSLDADELTPPNFKFCLKDKLLSSLEGDVVFNRVQDLNLSFNMFKGHEFKPLESCKDLQKLNLMGNQITSLASLPHLPNLEILSVAHNELNSLSMTSQPRLQELKANNNNISTLEGFPHLPVLEHLQVEENPRLRIPQLEVAIILLVGPSLKKLNKRDLSHDEEAKAKLYPAHTASCIREGWEFCRLELAADSTSRFLSNRWKVGFSLGYQLKIVSVDQPRVEDACYSHIVFIQDSSVSVVPPLILKYQWHIGEGTLLDFVAIPDATGEAYWPKPEEIGKVLKVECTPILGETKCNSVFAISSPVAPGNGIPRVLSLEVSGELVEGNTIRGHAKIAWCGGTPGKGVASWLRIRQNESPMVIVGAEDEEYQLTKVDKYSRLVFMYTPLTKEGAEGEPGYQCTDIVKPASPPSVGVWNYFGGSKLWNYFRGSKQGNEDSRSRVDARLSAHKKGDTGARDHLDKRPPVGHHVVEMSAYDGHNQGSSTTSTPLPLSHKDDVNLTLRSVLDDASLRDSEDNTEVEFWRGLLHKIINPFKRPILKIGPHVLFVGVLMVAKIAIAFLSPSDTAVEMWILMPTYVLYTGCCLIRGAQKWLVGESSVFDRVEVGLHLLGAFPQVLEWSILKGGPKICAALTASFVAFGIALSDTVKFFNKAEMMNCEKHGRMPQIVGDPVVRHPRCPLCE